MMMITMKHMTVASLEEEMGVEAMTLATHPHPVMISGKSGTMVLIAVPWRAVPFTGVEGMGMSSVPL